MKFDLSNYETVKERKIRFYQDNPDGRIIVNMVNPDSVMECALFVVTIYKNKEDQEKNLIWSTGYAFEVREKQLSISSYGKEYESVNYSSWTENAEESAVGRALDNAGYSGNKKCSREEMEKAQRMNKTMSKVNKTETPPTKSKDDVQRELIIEAAHKFAKKDKEWSDYLNKLIKACKTASKGVLDLAAVKIDCIEAFTYADWKYSPEDKQLYVDKIQKTKTIKECETIKGELEMFAK
ncbi:hypothetical protein H8E88_35810 [candidate division KSB1 bacterium]|nr:hypothetical protein [candidate division KSB1 bacterium]